MLFYFSTATDVIINYIFLSLPSVFARECQGGVDIITTSPYDESQDINFDRRGKVQTLGRVRSTTFSVEFRFTHNVF